MFVLVSAQAEAATFAEQVKNAWLEVEEDGEQKIERIKEDQHSCSASNFLSQQ